MSSAGHIFDMISRYEANRRMLRSRDRIADIKKMYATSAVRREALTYKELSPLQLAEVRKEVREKIRIRRRKSIIRTSLLILLFFILVAVIVWSVVHFHELFMDYRILKRI